MSKVYRFIIGFMLGVLMLLAYFYSNSIMHVEISKYEEEYVTEKTNYVITVEEVIPTKKQYRLLSDESILCLVQNAYFEARNQKSNDAVIAISMVVFNRVESEKFPNDICGVIYQTKRTHDGAIIKFGCQFTWYCDGKSDKMFNLNAKNRIEELVYESIVLWNTGIDITNGATHYHTKYVQPDWSNSFSYIKNIGDHKFYRWN